MAIGKFFVLRNARILRSCFLACTMLLAQPELSSWQDSNGCIFCINGKVSSGVCKHNSYKIKRNWQNTFFNLENKSGVHKLQLGYRTTLQVFCKNASNYCKTINDSLVIKSLPDIKERKHFCEIMDNDAKFFSGLTYSLPIEEKIQPGEISILCDFVHFDIDNQVLDFKDGGNCPIWVKINPYENELYQLEISKSGKKYNAKLKKILKKLVDGDMLYLDNFISISECKNSNCQILNYVEGKTQKVKIGCDFIKYNESSNINVTISDAGLCPIEYKTKLKESKKIYLRSQRINNSFSLMISGKSK
ncbi:hypothetical protein [Fibrobacter sp. UWH4]|uniref:hypothetical protein n=1 Tax=Fibrobacter sp. UWH4 TaxID=1896210 RepID=UPI0009155E7F|nr:hypothetical protein [Fibrobacter sp. UWH4]SHK88728.1 hypothetical protein SAMN05720762_103313 [Fibrobacter sp. UWH4]